jgi:hypothetical protein
MFKSCYPESNVTSDGSEPGDPFSSSNTIANYKALYRHPDGSGHTYTYDGYVYKPLEDIFFANPDVLFIPVTAPPLYYSSTTDANAARAREFNNWLKNEWLASYNAAHPGLNNVAVFDFFDVLAYAHTDPDYPDRLKNEYVRYSGDSHPNDDGKAAATLVFATGPNNFIDAAWNSYNIGAYLTEHLYLPVVTRLN